MNEIAQRFAQHVSAQAPRLGDLSTVLHQLSIMLGSRDDVQLAEQFEAGRG